MKNKTIKEMVVEMHTDIKWIKKELEGNGVEGLISKVNKNTKFRYVFTGSVMVLSFAIGLLFKFVV